MTATTPPAITAPGSSPDPTDRTTYNARAYAWMQWLKDHAVPEIYADALNCYNNALDAEASANDASSSAYTATTAVSGIGSSVSAAAASAINADISAIAALASLNNFKGVYYGAAASNPTLDPLGAAMSAGDLYYNTAVPEMRIYNGSAWVSAYLPAAGYATLTGAETLSNKSIDLGSNTLTMTSAQLKAALTDETGSGAAVFATSPTLVTPDIGAAIASGAINLTSGQISFPATQVPSAGANVLDDYEEGTWTPAIGGTATYTSQVGRYTKVGRYVYIEGLLSVATVGTGSTFTVSGLPFACNATSAVGAVTISHWSGSATAVTSVFGQVDGGASTFTLRSTTTATSTSSANAIFANGAFIYFAGHYTV